jgi:hypothetical protein
MRFEIHTRRADALQLSPASFVLYRSEHQGCGGFMIGPRSSETDEQELLIIGEQADGFDPS